MSTGSSPTTWIHYDKVHQIIGTNCSNNMEDMMMESGGSYTFEESSNTISSVPPSPNSPTLPLPSFSIPASPLPSSSLAQSPLPSSSLAQSPLPVPTKKKNKENVGDILKPLNDRLLSFMNSQEHFEKQILELEKEKNAMVKEVETERNNTLKEIAETNNKIAERMTAFMSFMANK